MIGNGNGCLRILKGKRDLVRAIHIISLGLFLRFMAGDLAGL
jgi:hypothetical protein